MSDTMTEETPKCHDCKSQNIDLLIPKGRKKKRNYLIYCHDCKAMSYAISLGKNTFKIRHYAEIRSYLKMGDNIY